MTMIMTMTMNMTMTMTMNLTMTMTMTTGVYLFDVIKLCAVKSSCYDFSKETSWVNYMANIAAIDTPNSSWTSCNFAGEIKLVFAG